MTYAEGVYVKKSRANIVALFVAGISLITAGAAFAQPIVPGDANGHASITHEQNDEIERFQREHPLDLVGLGNLVKKYTGEEMPVQVNGVDRTLTAKEAQQVMDRREKSSTVIGPLDVPVDAFTVAISWVPVVGPPLRKKAHGVWNFRDNYVNGSAPDDFASIGLQLGCSRIAYVTSAAYNYRNEVTPNGTFLQSTNLGSSAPIIGIRDTVSGFVMKADHGWMDVYIENARGCGYHTVGAAFEFEHNQDGGSVFSVSASFGSLSVGYNSVGSRLQKGTNPVYSKL